MVLMEDVGRVNGGIVGEQMNKFAQIPLFSFLHLLRYSLHHPYLPTCWESLVASPPENRTRISPGVQGLAIQIHTEPCPEIDAHVCMNSGSLPVLSSKLTPERGQPSCQGLCRSKWERKPSKQGCSQPCCSTDIICGTGENADAGMWALGWWPKAADGLTEEARMAAWQRD